MKIGSVLQQKYQVVRQIGKGGTSEVYLVKHLTLDCEMALKVIAKRADIPLDYSREAHILKDLRHPNLPRVIDVFQTDQQIFIVRDYIAGQTLEDAVDSSGPLSIQQLNDYCQQLASILGYLHSREQPIVYRDLKPSNIIIDKENKLFLIDFGTTRNYCASKDSDTLYLGTRGYAAPEQYGGGQSDVRTDVYALGATLYFLYTAEHWHTLSPDQQWRKFSNQNGSALKVIIEKAMALTPQARYDSIEQVSLELSKIVNPQSATQDDYPMGQQYHKKLTVAVMGATRGCGATHQTIALAADIKERIGPVAVIEKIGGGALSNLQRFAMDLDVNDPVTSSTFKYAGIQVYSGDSGDVFLKLVSSNKTSLVIDYGTHHYLLQDFLRAQIKCFIMPAQPWQVVDLTLLKTLAEYDDVYFVFNLCSTEQAKQMARWYNIDSRKVISIGYQAQPEKQGDAHAPYQQIFSQQRKSIIAKLFRR